MSVLRPSETVWSSSYDLFCVCGKKMRAEDVREKGVRDVGEVMERHWTALFQKVVHPKPNKGGLCTKTSIFMGRI